MEDTGAGVFGALQHLDLREIEAHRNQLGMYDDSDDENDEFYLSDLEPPKYKLNRKELKGELEAQTGYRAPFETYALHRGGVFFDI